MIFGSAVFIWCFFFEPRRYQINRYPITLKKKLGRPLRILHLSDIHFARPDKQISRLFDQLAAEQYDFIFATGDIIDCKRGINPCIINFKKLKARLGFFLVFGNHDYYDYHLRDVIKLNFRRGYPKTLQPVELFEKRLNEIKVRVLKNQTSEIKDAGVSLLVHGLDDPTTGKANIRLAMENFDSDKVNLLLTHTIDAFLEIGEGDIDLSFSGHSHGGQIRFPGIGAIITHTQMGPPFASGIKSLKGAICSISQGLGASRFFFMRMLCPPEAIILEVRGKD